TSILEAHWKSKEVVEDSDEEEQEVKDKVEEGAGAVKGTSKDKCKREVTLLAEWQDIATAVTRSLGKEEMEVEDDSVAGTSGTHASKTLVPWQETPQLGEWMDFPTPWLCLMILNGWVATLWYQSWHWTLLSIWKATGSGWQ
ncbi:hypothetical protein C0989_001710, partial [Termitomyces sp. Mn162]